MCVCTNVLEKVSIDAYFVHLRLDGASMARRLVMHVHGMSTRDARACTCAECGVGSQHVYTSADATRHANVVSIK
jgi:hypothetical protein